MGERDTAILEDAIETVYDRPDKHGDPEDSFSAIAEMWRAYFRSKGESDRAPTIIAEDVAQMMILLKMARNLEGVYQEDNWTDIAGYAECGGRMGDNDG